MRPRDLFFLSLTAVLGAGLDAQAAPASPAEAAIAQHYRAWLPLHPIEATDLGLHEAGFDGKLPDLTRAGRRARVEELEVAGKALAAAALRADCDETCQIDLEVVQQHIEAERLWALAPEERDGGLAIDVVAEGLFPLIKRDFSPLAQRAALAIARLDAVPKLLADALTSLRAGRRVTKSSIEIALEGLPGTADFIAHDVPAAFDKLTDRQLRARVGASAKRAADALLDYGKTLERELLPGAKAEFALGEALFVKMLHAEEMIDEPLPALLARGEAELKRLQLAFRQTAQRIDPSRDPRAVKDSLGKDHAPAAKLLGDVRAVLSSLRRFVIDKQIASITSDVLPIVEETPAFLRATTQASMDTPGPYERATQAYYHVTLPEPAWPAARVEDYLAGAFYRSLVEVVSIHEAFPGHYVQLLWSQRFKSDARRMQRNGANVEGWAHYCEEMMLEEGWGAGSDRIRLAQLSDALLRAARYVVAIKMHTRGMSLDEARRFFIDEGYQSSEVALLEAKRGTGDPMYLHYTWGKLEILKLRQDLKAKWGAGYTLKRFHDALLAEGPIPLPLIRRALLGP